MRSMALFCEGPVNCVETSEKALSRWFGETISVTITDSRSWTMRVANMQRGLTWPVLKEENVSITISGIEDLAYPTEEW